MKGILGAVCVLLLAAQLAAQDIRVDLSQEAIGRPPTTFEPQMGTWIVAQDGPDKVIRVDGDTWKAALDTPTRLLLDSARRMYGTTNEELLDSAKQFTNFPVAVMKNSPTFSNGTISVQFKTVGGNADRASGILFNLKPNGDWLCIRYNDTEHNIVLWEFHNGVRRSVMRAPDNTLLSAPGDREKWHTLALTVRGAEITTSIDGRDVLAYTLGSAPLPTRTGAPANPDLFSQNNAVIRPPVSGRIGLWSKTDSTVLFKNYVISPAK